MMIAHGLNKRQLGLISEIIKDVAPAVESVALFGSRATGTYRSYSDIDLVLYGKLDEATIDRLWTCFQESSLPFKVDVKAYELINHPSLNHPSLKEHIDRFARPLF